MGLFSRKPPVTPITSLEEFDAVTTDPDLPVLVYFHSPRSAQCRQINGLIKELRAQLDGRAEVTKVDAEEHAAIAKRLGVRSVPTLLVYRGGKLANRFNGLTDKASILKAMRLAEPA